MKVYFSFEIWWMKHLYLLVHNFLHRQEKHSYSISCIAFLKLEVTIVTNGKFENFHMISTACYHGNFVFCYIVTAPL